jgi:hypothetical protein
MWSEKIFPFIIMQSGDPRTILFASLSKADQHSTGETNKFKINIYFQSNCSSNSYEVYESTAARI